MDKAKNGANRPVPISMTQQRRSAPVRVLPFVPSAALTRRNKYATCYLALRIRASHSRCTSAQRPRTGQECYPCQRSLQARSDQTQNIQKYTAAANRRGVYVSMRRGKHYRACTANFFKTKRPCLQAKFAITSWRTTDTLYEN